MHRIISAVIAAILICLNSPGVVAAEATPGTSPREARGVWLHLSGFSADAVQGKREVHQMVERLAKANFNFIMPWVLSEYAAALTDTNYQSAARTAKWDALGELAREAARGGMQVHLWYSFTHYKSPQSPDFNPSHGGSPSWAAR